MGENPVVFTPEQVLALCGGQMPYANGFAWDTVEEFRLENGALEPYEGEEILPGPGLRFQLLGDERFPRYQMFVDDNELWQSLREAGRTYDFGFAPVRIGGKVLDQGGLVRDITDEEKSRISEIAEEYSDSK